MLLVVSCWLFVIACCSPCVVRCFVVGRLLFGACSSLFVAWCVLRVVCCLFVSLFSVCVLSVVFRCLIAVCKCCLVSVVLLRLLLSVRCLLCVVVSWLLGVGCCSLLLLFVGCCVLFVVG